jgi:hypothetical protein
MSEQPWGGFVAGLPPEPEPSRNRATSEPPPQPNRDLTLFESGRLPNAHQGARAPQASDEDRQFAAAMRLFPPVR